ncbi:thiazole synthase [Candidatus Sumerlaeota bacterium]|nr:thiazole synthase [Candidatus Sumerlaeota bacterium]
MSANEQGDILRIGNRTFRSRLFVGTGKYATFDLMAQALEASGCEVVTVAIRRLNLNAPAGEKTLLDYIDPNRYKILPNTAACYCKEDAIKVARVARELGLGNWIKLEVLGSEKTLLPDPVETLEALRVLVKEGFEVYAYTNDDPVLAKKLEEAGAATVMPLGSPIGSGQGILNRVNVRLIIENATVPIIVDAGVGTASDVAIAMELGADGVLLNTGIAGAKDPVKMAHAMRHAVEGGRLASLAGRIPRKMYASASSPMLDF